MVFVKKIPQKTKKQPNFKRPNTSGKKPVKNKRHPYSIR